MFGSRLKAIITATLSITCARPHLNYFPSVKFSQLTINNRDLDVVFLAERFKLSNVAILAVQKHAVELHMTWRKCMLAFTLLVASCDWGSPVQNMKKQTNEQINNL